MPSPSTFVPVSGGMIRDLRKAMNYSQATLASKVGVSKATIVNIERGVTEQMREPNALKLAEALGVGVKKITGVKEVAKTSDAFEALGLSAGEQTRPDRVAFQGFADEDGANQALSYIWYDVMQQAVTFTYALNNQGEYRLVARFQGKPSAKFGNVGLWPYRQVPRRILAGQTHLGFGAKIVSNPDRRRLGVSVRIIDRMARDWLLRTKPVGNAPDLPYVMELDLRSRWTPCLVPLKPEPKGMLYWSLFRKKRADHRDTIRPDMSTIARVVVQYCIASETAPTSAENGEIWISPLWLGDEQGIGERLPTSDAEGRKKLAKNSSK